MPVEKHLKGNVILPGGEVIAGMGGFLRIGTLGQDLSKIVNFDLDEPYSRIVNVGAWYGQRFFRNAEMTHSGCIGSISRRRIAYDWAVRIEVPLDVAKPSDYRLQDKMSVGVALMVGDWNEYIDNNHVKYYVSPSGLLEDVQTISDSTGKDVVRQTCVVRANARMFLIPEERLDYDAYIQKLIRQGWLQ